MPELIRTIAARLREYVGNRRRTPRYRVRWPVSVSPLEARKSPNGARVAMRAALSGFTRDVSASGLGLILPAIRINDVYLTEGRTLEILLEHQNGPIIMYAVTVRYEKLDEEAEEATEKGYLVGMRIMEMEETDRARFIESLEKMTAE